MYRAVWPGFFAVFRTGKKFTICSLYSGDEVAENVFSQYYVAKTK